MNKVLLNSDVMDRALEIWRSRPDTPKESKEPDFRSGAWARSLHQAVDELMPPVTQ